MTAGKASSGVTRESWSVSWFKLPPLSPESEREESRVLITRVFIVGLFGKLHAKTSSQVNLVTQGLVRTEGRSRIADPDLTSEAISDTEKRL